MALPFRLRSAPKIFSAVADALQWILVHKGVKNILHYLDDFILVAGSLAEANVQKEILVSTCSALGVPLEPTKLEGPSTCLTFLGNEFDTVALQLRLPMDKLLCMKAGLNSAITRKSMKKRDLQSLTGLLQHATKVIQPRRPFLQRLYALQSVGSFPHHQIHFNIAAREILFGGISLWTAGMGCLYCGVWDFPHLTSW